MLIFPGFPNSLSTYRLLTCIPWDQVIICRGRAPRMPPAPGYTFSMGGEPKMPQGRKMSRPSNNENTIKSR